VCTPVDALRCFIKANLDALILEDFIVRPEMISEELRDAVQLWYPEVPESNLKSSVYTFV
jgi:hypothetical protein